VHAGDVQQPQGKGRATGRFGGQQQGRHRPRLAAGLVWPPLSTYPYNNDFGRFAFTSFVTPAALHESPTRRLPYISFKQLIPFTRQVRCTAFALMLPHDISDPQSQKRERAALFLVQENPSEYGNLSPSMLPLDNNAPLQHSIRFLSLQFEHYSLTSFPFRQKILLLWGESDNIFNIELAETMKE
jgi:hypothetical protein